MGYKKYDKKGALVHENKNPTRKQKELIKRNRLVPENWLILKAPTNELHIQNRASGIISYV